MHLTSTFDHKDFGPVICDIFSYIKPHIIADSGRFVRSVHSLNCEFNFVSVPL